MPRAESPFSDASVIRAVKDLRGGDLGQIVAYLCAHTTHKNQLRRLGRAKKLVHGLPPGGLGRFAWRRDKRRLPASLPYPKFAQQHLFKAVG